MIDLKLLFKNVILGNIILNNWIGVVLMVCISVIFEGVVIN